MDEMKIKLSTVFMRNLASNLLSKIIYKQLGVKTDIKVNGLEAELKDKKVHFHLDIDGSFNENVFVKINRLIDSEK